MKKYTAVTTNAELKSGGTGSFWFGTDKSEADKELVQEFLTRFPTLKSMWKITIMSKERGKDMLPKYSNTFHVEDL